MSMLTTHFSNLCMTPAIVKKLLGFRVTPAIQQSSPASPPQQQPQQSVNNSMETVVTASTSSLTPSSPMAAAEMSPASVSSTASSPGAASASTLLIRNSTAFDNQQQQQAHHKMCEKAIRALVKKLKKTPGALDELERAITTRDPSTKCIIVPINKSSNGANNNQQQVISRKTLPHVVYCRIWRFADLQSSNELRSVPHCQYGYNANHPQASSKMSSSSSDEQMVCINPYHYVRNETAGNNNSASSHPPLTVYVPAKLQLQQQAAANSNSSNNMMAMDTMMSSAMGPSSASPQDDLMAGMSASNFMQNFHGSVNSPATPSSASILSPSSIGSNMNSHQFSPFISEDDASEINSLISPSPPLMTYVGTPSSVSSPPPPTHLQAPLGPPPPLSSHQQQQQQQLEQQQQQSPMDMLAVPMVPQPYWCSISYYEMKQRVGEMFHVAATVNSVTIDGYTDPSSASRFCLGVLSNVNRSQEIEMTRHYIGKGLMLSYENGQVFAECLSENPVFVQSPNCNQRYNWHLATVVKIPPKCQLKIFDEADFVNMANMTVYQGFEAVYALTRICTIRISFVKGWGAEYRRQTILNTPCWIEVHLNNPLKLVDQILTKMGSPRTIATSVS